MMNSKRYTERGFNNEWLDKSDYDMHSKCKFHDYYFPNYDFGIKAMWPFHKWLEKDC